MCLAHTADALHDRDLGVQGPPHDRPAGSAGVSRRTALTAGAGAALAALLPTPASAAVRSPAHRRGRLQDLTHTFRTDFPVFAIGEEPTRRTSVTIEDNGYYLQEWTFYEHTATHVDAPGHFSPGGRLAPDLTVEELLDFPGFDAEAVDWLLRRRRITAIGVDTLSLDPGPSATFDAHVTLLGADRYGLENLANLDRIPPQGATLIVGLVPWEKGSGGPCRVLAQW